MKNIISFLSSISSRIILVDFDYFIQKAVEIRGNPPHYLALNMLISNLRNVAVTPEDTVIIAVNSELNSWRKDIDKNYKEKSFYDVNSLLNDFDKSTVFHVIQIAKVEAKDIIAVACKFFKTKCLVISSDSSLEQLSAYQNVVLFSPVSKKYKEINNPYKVISTKIKKERADNLISPILTQLDFDRKNKVINLLNLPENIVQSVEQQLVDLPIKEFKLARLQYSKLYENLYCSNVKLPRTRKRKAEQLLI